MDKYLVEVYVPAIDSTYDVFVPQKSKIKDVIMLVSKMIYEISEGKYMANNSTVLCDAVTGDILDINLSVYEQNIHNGSKLMLI